MKKLPEQPELRNNLPAASRRRPELARSTAKGGSDEILKTETGFVCCARCCWQTRHFVLSRVLLRTFGPHGGCRTRTASKERNVPRQSGGDFSPFGPPGRCFTACARATDSGRAGRYGRGGTVGAA